MPWFPTFRYHAVLAPSGRKFTDEAEFLALSDEWVDTPAKFSPAMPAEDLEGFHVEPLTVQDVPRDVLRRRSRRTTEVPS